MGIAMMLSQSSAESVSIMLWRRVFFLRPSTNRLQSKPEMDEKNVSSRVFLKQNRRKDRERLPTLCKKIHTFIAGGSCPTNRVTSPVH